MRLNTINREVERKLAEAMEQGIDTKTMVQDLERKVEESLKK